MQKAFLAILLILALVARADTNSPPSATRTAPSIAVMVGDSLTYGHAGTKGTWPYSESLTNLLSGYFINTTNLGMNGATSTQSADAFLTNTSLHGKLTIIWIGNNNATATNTILADIERIIAKSDPSFYLVCGLHWGDYRASSNAAEYQTITNFNWILRHKYGPRYVDIHAALMAARDPANPEDTARAALDLPPTSTRADITTDPIHLSRLGYSIVGRAIAARLAPLLADMPTRSDNIAGAMSSLAAKWQWAAPASTHPRVDVTISDVTLPGVIDMGTKAYTPAIRYMLGPNPDAKTLDLRYFWLTQADDNPVFLNQVRPLWSATVLQQFISFNTSTRTTNAIGNGSSAYGGWSIVTEELTIPWTNGCAQLLVCRDNFPSRTNQYHIGLQYRYR